MARVWTSLSRRLSKLAGDEEGSAMLEAAFAMPLFLILFLGTLGWSYFLLRQIVLQYSVEYSSRCAIIPLVNGVSQPLCGTYQTFGAANGLGLFPDLNTFSVAPDKSVTNSGYQYTLTCIRAESTNPLGFLQSFSLPVGGVSVQLMVPSASRASFCRVNPQK